MGKIWTRALLTCVALAGANFGYQILRNSNWPEATERTFFQVIAIIIFAVALSR